MKLIKAMRGTRDIYDVEALKFNFIEDTAKELLENYGFGRIITPTFESTDLFKRGIGEGTDIVDKEMYTFSDRGDRSITLRPEGTAAVVRSYLENKTYAKEDLTKYYYVNNMFRYERPQAGRYREFYQVGVEVLGNASPMADAEVISVGYRLMEKLGIEDLKVNINSVGGNETRAKYRKLLVDYLTPKKNELCSDCQNRYEANPLRVLDCKNEGCQNLTIDAPTLPDNLNDQEKDHYETVKKYLDIFGVKYVENPRLVRGLDYYSSTVFEVITEKLGSQGTVLGGGRYDNLIKQIGDKDVSAVGFGAGIDRLMMLLNEDQILNTPDVYISWLDEENIDYAFLVANTLRDNNVKVYIEYAPKSANAHRKKAFKLGAKKEIIIDSESKTNKTLGLKELSSRDIEIINFNEILEKIR
ncbi:MAG TPA: histidine--tRNA ligase [Fusobacteriaceae bacterium]|nr:histidine--tRNA ligase [Fusobacteriaceae bacterium]